jgi:hypothetical protein
MEQPSSDGHSELDRQKVLGRKSSVTVQKIYCDIFSYIENHAVKMFWTYI